MADAASGQLSHSPTMARHATEAGFILGTAAYMSPEQARGKAVDKRADICRSAWCSSRCCPAHACSRVTPSPTSSPPCSRASPTGRRFRPPRRPHSPECDQKAGERDIWIGDLQRGTRTRLTLGKGANTDRIWSPDGRLITFASTREGGLINLFSVPADGSGEAVRLTRTADDERAVFPRRWLRDGSALVFPVIRASGDIGLWRKDSGAEEQLLANPFDELQPSLSPDERFMAYALDESGRREVYIRDMRGSGRRIPMSSEGGDEPVWSPMGNEIFYRRGSQMISVQVSTGGDLTVGATSVLFDVPFDADPFNRDATNYDVTRDGQRFIMIRRTSESGGSRQRLDIVVNWTEALKRLAREK